MVRAHGVLTCGSFCADAHTVLTAWPPPCLCDQYGEAAGRAGTGGGNSDVSLLGSRRNGWSGGGGMVLTTPPFSSLSLTNTLEEEEWGQQSGSASREDCKVLKGS